MAGYTLEQLQSMGAKPINSPAQKTGGLTLDQIMQKGAKPIANAQLPQVQDTNKAIASSKGWFSQTGKNIKDIETQINNGYNFIDLKEN